MSSSKGLSVFALIIGIIGLGLAGYTFFLVLPIQTVKEQTSVQNMWSTSYNGPSIDVYNVDTIIPNLSVEATVYSGESLHVLYNTNVFMDCDGAIEILFVYVSLNGQKVGESATNFGANHDHNIWGQLSLQYSNSTISAGIYNISIIAFSTDPSNPNNLYDMTLLAFTSK